MNRKNEKLNKDFVFCYPILEDTEVGVYKKITEVCKEPKTIIELRADYLLNANLGIDDIIRIIDNIKSKYSKKDLIVTIRTVKEGGRVDLTNETYYFYIKELYMKSKAKYIDVEYRFYNMDKSLYDILFIKKKKKVILSMHIFDKILLRDEYKKLFTEMAKSGGDIVKFAIKIYSKEDLFMFMMTAKNCEKIMAKYKKNKVYIAMGTLGLISRLWHEFTGTMIVFLTAYKDIDTELGQVNRENYIKYRKLLAKSLKN